MVKSHSQNRCVFRHLRNAAKVSVSLIVIVGHPRAWEQSWKRLGTQTVFWCVLLHNMGSVGVVAMMSKGVVLAYYAQDRLAGSVVHVYVAGTAVTSAWPK